MINPFEQIQTKLDNIEVILKELRLEKMTTTPQALPQYIDRKEAAKILGVSKPTMIKYQKEGVLPSYRIGSRVRYKRDEVIAAFKKVQSIKHKRV